MTSDDEVEWLDSALAVQLTVQRSGEPLQSQILRRASDGIMRARASRYIVTGPNSPPEPVIEVLQGREQHGYVSLPESFFWNVEGREFEADWLTGDFSNLIFDYWCCRAYGVQFARQDLIAMAPVVPRSVNSTIPLPAHTVRELEQWILDAPQTNADLAFNFYKLDPRYNGVKQEEFRRLWGQNKNTKRGGQQKPKS